jgi:dual specificity MAP kinase phosphatase
VPLCQNSLLVEDPFIGGETNPFSFDLCIECVDGAHFPSAAELACVEHHLRKLDEQWVDHWRAAAGAGADADASNRSERIPPRPSPNPTHVVHIQFPSSPGSSQHAISGMMNFISFLHRVLYPAPNGALEEPPASLSSIFTPRRPSASERSTIPPTLSTPRKCHVLLWSSDGYTETSILTLCLLMSPKPAHYIAPHPTASSVLGVSADASHTLQPAPPGKIRPADSRTAGYGGASKNHGSMSLPEAYLELQITRQRSFFVYQNDLDLLKKIESKLLSSGKESMIRSKERERERDLIAGGVTRDGASELSASSGSRWKFPTWGTRSGSLSIPNPPVIEEAPATSSIGPPKVFPSLSTSTPSTTLLGSTNIAPRKRARASTSPMPNVLAEHWAWFNDPRFDGSFPSRVLPFLYLGNLYVSNCPSDLY